MGGIVSKKPARVCLDQPCYVGQILLSFALAAALVGVSPNFPLKNIIRRSPRNPHALFLLGTHLFWTEGLTSEAIKHLERCLEVRPKFLRAWACLGTIYKRIEQPALAVRAFRRCIALETNQRMREYFKGMIESSKSA